MNCSASFCFRCTVHIERKQKRGIEKKQQRGIGKQKVGKREQEGSRGEGVCLAKGNLEHALAFVTPPLG